MTKVRAKVSFLDNGKMRRKGDVFSVEGSILKALLNYHLVEIVEEEYTTKVIKPVAKITYNTKTDEIITPSREKKNAKRKRKSDIN